MMMNAQKGEEFRKYRDIAPEAVEDATIMNLIQKSAGNHSAITAAIENMWHDLPDEKAVGVRDEWNTTSKSRAKKDVVAPNQGGDRGGRGGRGRSMPPSGGRGQGAGGRGERVSGRGLGASQGRGSSAARPAAATATVAPAPTPAIQPVAAVTPVVEPPLLNSAPSNGASGWGWGGTTLAQKLKQAEIQKLLPTPVPAPEIVVEEIPVIDADVVEVVEAADGQDVEGNEEEDIEDVVRVADVITVEEVEVVTEEVVEPLRRDIVAETDREEIRVVLPVPVAQPVSVILVPAPEVLREREVIVQVQELVQESAPKAFLKMGKWEAPLESSAFQFGSFGNFSSSNVDSISASTPAPWGGVAENTEQQGLEGTAGVWGGPSNGTDVSSSASSSSGPSPMSSLFPAPKGLPSVLSETPAGVSSSSQSQGGRYDQQKPSAPPGLEPHPHSSMSKPLPIPRQDTRTTPPAQSQSRGKHESNQQLQQQQQQQQQQLHQYQPQYQQPAAIPPATARGNAPAASSIPYGYAPGFESQPQYQPPYQPTPAMPAAVTGSSPVAASGAPAAQQASVGAPQGQQQGQLQYGPPPGMPSHYGNPYYGSPYYANPAYFYGQPQVQNPYYNQGRDYQAPRPYGADPYAPGVQYPVYQQGGGFPDASGSYPNMPMQQQQHPSMGPQGQGAVAATGAAATGGQGKQQKGVGASSAAPQQQQQQQQQQQPQHQQQQQQQDPNQVYGYNPYNPRDAQWQYQQSAPGWGAPMMGFPGGPGQSPPGAQGFSQGQPPQSAGQGQRPSASYGGPPGQGHQPQQGQGQGQGQPFSRGPVPNAAGPSSGGSSGQHW